MEKYLRYHRPRETLVLDLSGLRITAAIGTSGASWLVGGTSSRPGEPCNPHRETFLSSGEVDLFFDITQWKILMILVPWNPIRIPPNTIEPLLNLIEILLHQLQSPWNHNDIPFKLDKHSIIPWNPMKSHEIPWNPMIPISLQSHETSKHCVSRLAKPSSSLSASGACGQRQLISCL